MAKITGYGMYAPKVIVPNQYFVDNNPLHIYGPGEVSTGTLDTSDKWIFDRTGIRTRHWAADDETVPDMAAIAVARALEKAGREPRDLDGIILASVTQEMQFPDDAAQILELVGAENAHYTYDVGSACAGFPIALQNAVYKTIVEKGGVYAVVGAEKLSRMVDENSIDGILLGDGAGAFIVEHTNPQEGQFHAFYEKKNTSKGKLSWIYRGKEGKFRMPFGKKVYREATTELPIAARELAERAGWNLSEVDLFAFHQANGRILEAVAEDLEIPTPERERRVPIIIDEYGNTSAASIPMTYTLTQGELKPGSKVVAVAIGAGMGITGAAWTT